MTESIAQGDTPNPKFITAVIDSVTQDMSAAGWECHTSVMDDNRQIVVSERPVTDLEVVDGSAQFRASLTLAESDLMVVTGPVAKRFIWTIQVKNTVQNYRREHDVNLLVRSGGVINQ